MNNDDMEVLTKTYEIGTDGIWIRCLVCGVTSHNLNDVEERYCGNCHKFHEGEIT